MFPLDVMLRNRTVSGIANVFLELRCHYTDRMQRLGTLYVASMRAKLLLRKRSRMRMTQSLQLSSTQSYNLSLINWIALITRPPIPMTMETWRNTVRWWTRRLGNSRHLPKFPAYASWSGRSLCRDSKSSCRGESPNNLCVRICLSSL